MWFTQKNKTKKKQKRRLEYPASSGFSKASPFSMCRSRVRYFALSDLALSACLDLFSRQREIPDMRTTMSASRVRLEEQPRENKSSASCSKGYCSTNTRAKEISRSGRFQISSKGTGFLRSFSG